MPSKGPFIPRKHTNIFLQWVTITCSVITITVVLTSIAVFVGYAVIQPKVPFVSIAYAHLDVFDYNQTGLLTTAVTIDVKWENDNARVHSSFYNAGFVLSFHGLQIAKFGPDPFELSKKSSLMFHYPLVSTPILLNQEQMLFTDLSLKRDLVTFDLRGVARTRWRVGALGSVKFWLNLNCRLHFIRSTMNSTGLHCSSKS